MPPWLRKDGSWECKVSGDTEFTVRKKKERKTGTQPSFFFLFSARLQTTENASYIQCFLVTSVTASRIMAIGFCLT